MFVYMCVVSVLKVYCVQDTGVRERIIGSMSCMDLMMRGVLVVGTGRGGG